MKKYFSIGETAGINNVSVQALRLYERIGILKPAFIDPHTGYRYYTVDQFIYLDLIKYSKYIKLPLKRLKDIFESEDTSDLSDLLSHQLKEIRKQMAELTYVSRDIKYIISRLQYVQRNQYNNEPFIREMPARSVVIQAFDESKSFDHTEIASRIFENKLVDLGYDIEYEYGAFLDVSNPDHIRYKKVYVRVYDDGLAQHPVDIIPFGDYVCLSYQIDDQRKAVESMQAYLAKNHIRHSDDFIEIQYLGAHLYYFCELQVRIMKSGGAAHAQS